MTTDQNAGSHTPHPGISETGSAFSAGRAWWLLGILAFFYAYTFIDRFIISILVPDIKASIGLSDSAMGLVMGPVPTIIFAVVSLLSGWAVDRYPRRRIMVGGMILFAAGTAGLGLGNTFATVLTARAVAAIGEATVFAAAYSLIADAFARKRIGTALAIFQMGGKFGMAGALASGGLIVVFARKLVTEGHGYGLDPWQLVFVAIGASMLLFAPLALTFREPPRRGILVTEGDKGALMAFVRKERTLLLLMLFGFLPIQMTGYAMTSWVPTYLARHFNLTPVQYGPVLGGIALAAAAILVVKGSLLDYFYSRGSKDIAIRFFLWLLLATTPAFAVMFFVASPWVFIALFGLVQIVTIPYISYATTAIQSIAPGNVRGRLMSFALVCVAVAGGLGTLVIGLITDHVFHDEAKIGYSFAVMMGMLLPLSFICLTRSLKHLRAAVIAAEERDVAVAAQ